MPAVLGDYDFSGNVDASATFQIIPGPNRITFAKQPTSSDDPTLGIAMSTSVASSPFYLYNATATFNRAVNFSHADSEGEEIELFGQKFTIGSATDDDELVLFRAAETLQLSVGSASSIPSQTITVDGATYTVELTAASDTSATIKVTDSAGQSDQKEINEASSKKILGLEVAVNNADESTATNIIQAEVTVGADRIKLQHGTTVFVGTDDDPIDGTRVTFTNSSTDRVGSLTKIDVSVFAPSGSHDAIQEGDEFVDPVFGAFRLAFTGFNLGEDDWETISVKAAGTEKVALSFTNWQDKSLSSLEFVNNESSTSPSIAFLGDSDEWRIYVQEMATINKSSYAVIGNEDDGYLVKLRTLTNSTGSGSNTYSSDRVVFENVLDTSQSWEATITSEGVGTITIGGKSYDVNYKYNTAVAEEQAHVRLNDGDSSGNNQILYNTIETSKGAKLAFYEPLNITLDNWDGSGADATGILLPDGDGYTTLAVANTTPTADTNFLNWTIGTAGAATSFATNESTQSINATIGRLTYSFRGGGAANTTRVYLLDPRTGARIDYPSIILFEEKDESDVYNVAIVQTAGGGTSTNGMGVGDTDFTWNSDNDFSGTAWGTSGFKRESNDDLYDQMDQWGTKVTTDQSDSDQYSVEVMYPNEQVTPLIYFDSLVGGSSSSTLGNVQVMDDELASSGLSSKNLIVVGGSCVNSAASSLLGSAGCGASWTAATKATSGEWIIQTFANPWAGSKIATLVAGWEQGDTANAATYLTTQNPSTGVGTKLTGTTATAATPVTV